jgi:hypothetical protein
MKKLLSFLVVGILFLQVTSCATIMGGQVTAYQKTKPAPGQPQREVKIGPLICDVIFWGGGGLIVDFATGAIYKPAPNK